MIIKRMFWWGVVALITFVSVFILSDYSLWGLMCSAAALMWCFMLSIPMLLGE